MGGPHQTSIETDARTRAVLCDSVAGALSPELEAEGFDVVTANTLADVADHTEPSESFIVVFDGSVSGWLRSVSDLRAQRPGAAIVFFGDVDGPEEFLAAVAAGVDGFCAHGAPVEALVRTVREVEASGAAIPRSFAAPLVDHVRHGRGRTVNSAAGGIEVTDREWEILQLLMQRRSTREMADALYVSTGTVRCHVSTLLGKLGAVDRDDAVAMIERSDRTA